MDNPDYRIRTTLFLCSGRRADDASIQNPYPQKMDRWDEAGQTTTIVGIPNKHSNIQTFKHSNIQTFCAFFN
jgi:hypothetical protein